MTLRLTVRVHGHPELLVAELNDEGLALLTAAVLERLRDTGHQAERMHTPADPAVGEAQAIADRAAEHLANVGVDHESGLRAAVHASMPKLLDAITHDPRFEWTLPPSGIKHNANCWTLATGGQDEHQTSTDEQNTHA